jgi:hypothetical protein
MRAGFLPRRLRVRVPRGRLSASSFSGRTLGSDPSNGRSNRPRGSHHPEAQQDARPVPIRQVAGSSPVGVTSLFTGNAEGRRARLLTESTPVRPRPCEPSTGSSVARTRGR